MSAEDARKLVGFEFETRPPVVRLTSHVCERDDLQVVSPIAVDEEKGEVLQWKATYSAPSTSDNFADRRMFRYEIDHRLYVVPEPVPQTSRL